MKRFKLFLIMVLLGVITITASGCFMLLAAGAGAGSVVYINGAYERNVSASVGDVHAAALKVLKEKGWVMTADNLGKMNSRIYFMLDDGKKCEIAVEALTEKVSKIVVRIGVLGEEDRSWDILEGIISNL